MRFGIIVFPGSNCDRDCQYVIEKHLKETACFIWHKDEALPKGIDAIIIPGGFSYGDYLRTGAIARLSPIMNAVTRFANEGGRVLGICNGFQILTEAALLPGTFLRNRSLKFVCQSVYITVDNNALPFTSRYDKNEILSIPIAHAEGNYYIDDVGLSSLKDNRQIVFRYCNAEGICVDGINPNGSVFNIAGLCNKEGNVLGMMPHLERASDPMLNAVDGIRMFLSLCHP